MNAPLPLVSIGMPVYNGERHLREALDSLMAQDYPSLEIVISDNASEDATASICREYQARDPRIRYHRNAANLGAARNFNQVFGLCSGEFFMWAACDNIVAPSFVRQCARLLLQYPEASVCHAQCQFISSEGRPFGPAHVNYQNTDSKSTARWRRVLADRDYPEWYTAVYGLMRAQCMRRTGLMRTVWGADQIFIAEISLYGTIVQVPEQLWWLRQHDEVTSSDEIYQSVMRKLDPARSKMKRRWTQFGIHRECARIARNAPWPLPVRLQLWAGAIVSYFSTGGWLNDLEELHAVGAVLQRVRDLLKPQALPGKLSVKERDEPQQSA